MSSSNEKRTKNWKHLYLRSRKLARAVQLGMDYPVVSNHQVARSEDADAAGQLNVLFVCSRNEWRSPTAEAVFSKHEGLRVRSCGTSSKARRRVNAKDLEWAYAVMVMEEKHKLRLLGEFERLLEYKPIHVLDIPDEYQFMDPELVEELKRTVGEFID